MPKQRYEITEVYRAFDGREWAIGYKGGNEVATCSSRHDAELVRDALEKRLSHDALLAVAKRWEAIEEGRCDCDLYDTKNGELCPGCATRAAIAQAKGGA
jgi:coenzyme F420-reducing hydrogenase gamma subunit